jgi:hypothetical protein
MTVLDLNKHREFSSKEVPASAFPDPATTYVCDKCGRDITKYLHRGRAHTWQPMGPQRYICRCGQRWLSGAVEWDHLGGWERRRRVRDTLALSIAFAVLAAIPAVITYAALHAWTGAPILAGLMIALPAILITVPFWICVAASLWRTRFRG